MRSKGRPWIYITLIAALACAGVVTWVTLASSGERKRTASSLKGLHPAIPSGNTVPRGIAEEKPQSPASNVVIRSENSHWEALTKELEQTIDERAVQRFLDARSRTPGSLLAAWELTGDISYLTEAASQHPNVPAVQLAVALHDDTGPEARTRSLMNARESDPDNAFPDVILAADAFKAGSTAEALEWLEAAASKPVLDSYARSLQADREDLLLSAGLSPRSAAMRALLSDKASVPSSVFRPAISGAVAELKRALAENDEAGVERILSSGVSVFRKINSEDAGNSIYVSMVGAAGEDALLRALPPGYSSLPGESATAAERLAEIDADRAEWKSLIPVSSQLFLMEAEFLDSYINRAKQFGELEALRWAKPIMDARNLPPIGEP